MSGDAFGGQGSGCADLSSRVLLTRGLVLSLAAVHLILVAAFAGYQGGFQRWPLVGPFLTAYCEASGAHASFNFFAPRVASQVRARMLLERADGRTLQATFNTGSHEADLRIGTTFLSFDLPEARPLLMRSWAAYALKTHPDARAITIIVELYGVPSLESAGRGARASWHEMGQERFVL